MKEFYELDCSKYHFLTQVGIPIKVIFKVNEAYIFNVQDDADASYNVKSKPRTDDIDYVTYILGALGSWIGFSLIGINSIPYSIEIQRIQITAEIEHD